MSNGEVSSNAVCCVLIAVVIPIPAVVIVVVVPVLLHVVHLVLSFFSFVVPVPSVIHILR